MNKTHGWKFLAQILHFFLGSQNRKVLPLNRFFDEEFLQIKNQSLKKIEKLKINGMWSEFISFKKEQFKLKFFYEVFISLLHSLKFIKKLKKRLISKSL